VVKTDWTTPTREERTWDIQDSNSVVHQNNAVIASMMVPGTNFGAATGTTSLYENIFVEDRPQVLFSLKIVPPRDNSNTESLNLTTGSTLNLNIENVFTPPSKVKIRSDSTSLREITYSRPGALLGQPVASLITTTH
jgi:hypothetical protein